MPALTYPQVLAQYDRARAFGETRSLKDYSANMGQMLDTHDYDEGQRDGWWARFSTRADQNFFKPIGEATTGPIAEGIGDLFGHGDAAREVGEGLPRGLAEMAPLAIPGFGPFITGGLMGAHTYADTGSVGQAVVSGATGALLPKVSEVGGNLMARAFGASPLKGVLANAAGELEPFSRTLAHEGADYAKQQAARFVGSQAATIGLNQASMYASDKLAGQAYDPMDEKFWVNQIPFTVFDAYHAATGPKVTYEGMKGQVKSAAAEPTPQRDFTPATGSDEDRARVEKLMSDIAGVANDPTVDPTEKGAKLAALNLAINDPAKAGEVLAEGVKSEEPKDLKFQGTGYQLPNGKWKVKVEGGLEGKGIDDFMGKLSPEHQNVWVNDPSKITVLPDGKVQFNGMSSDLDSQAYNVTHPVRLEDAPFLDPKANPILPEQEKPGSADFVGPKEGTLEQPELPVRQGTPVPAMQDSDLEEKVPEGEGDVFSNVQKSIAKTPPPIPETTLVPPEVRTLTTEMNAPAPLVEKAVEVPRQKLAKADNLILDSFAGLIEQDEDGIVRRIGTSDVAKDGWMNEVRFGKATQLPEALLSALKETMPEAFRDGEVDVHSVVKKLKEENPVVSVRELGVPGGASDPATIQRSELQHKLDTEFPGWDSRAPEERTEAEKIILKQYDALVSVEKSHAPESATARFSTVNPYPPEVLRGEKEVASGHKIVFAGDVSVNVPLAPAEKGTPNWDSVPANNYKFWNEGHYPSDAGKNQLGFSRFAIHEYQPGAVLPDGSVATRVVKLAEVWEVQSDWASKLQKTKSSLSGRVDKNLNHPLLSIWEPLTYKATLQKAMSMGAEGVVLSDAESAMMTEGHDKALSWRFKATPENKEIFTRRGVKVDEKDGYLYSRTSSEIDPESAKEMGGVLQRPSQSPGMTAAYDERGPAILSKLTGEKGKKVVMGVHQNAIERAPNFEANTTTDFGPETGKVGSPVFRDSTGAPKTLNTGRYFPFSKLAAGLQADPTLSLKEAVQAYEQGVAREARARSAAQQILASSEAITPLIGPPEVAKPVLQLALEQGLTSEQATTQAVLKQVSEDLDKGVVEKQAAKKKVNNLLYPRSLKGPDGKSIYFGRGQKEVIGENEANNYLAEHERENPEQVGMYKVSHGGLYGEGPREGVFRGYKIVRSDTASFVSLDALGGLDLRPQEEKSTSSQERLDASGVRESAAIDLSADPSERPDSGIERIKNNIQLAKKDVGRFADSLGLDRNEPLDMLKAGRMLKQAEVLYDKAWSEGASLEKLNEELKGKGITPFKDAREAASVRRLVGQASDEFNPDALAFHAGSIPVHDEALAVKLGLRGPDKIQSWLTWFADHPKSGVFGEYARALIKAVDLKQVELDLPGDPYHDPKSFWEYKSLGGTQPVINGWLPRDEADAFEQGQHLLHEVNHYAFREILGGHEGVGISPQRNDPRAIELMQALEEGRQALINSKNMPKVVRNLIKKSINENFYDKYTKGEISLHDEWGKVLGKDLKNKWSGVMYGLLNNDELAAQMGSHQPMVDHMLATPAPRGLGQSVLHFLSGVWHKVFGGATSDPSVFAMIMQKADNYLGGVMMPKGYGAMDYVRDSLLNEGVMPDTLAGRLQAIRRVYETGNIKHSMNQLDDELDAGQLHSSNKYEGTDLNMSVALQHGNVDHVRTETMNTLAAGVPGLGELHARLQQDMRMVATLYSKIDEGTVPGINPPDLSDKIAVYGAKLNAMKKALGKQALAIRRYTDLSNFTQAGMEATLAKALADSRVPEAPDPTGVQEEALRALALRPEEKDERGGNSLKDLRGETTLSGVGGWLRKTFLFMQYLKQQVPGIRPIADHLDEEQARMNYVGDHMKVAFNSDPATGEPSKAITKLNRQTMGDSTLRRAFSDISRWIQVQQRDPATRNWNIADPFVKNVLAPLGEGARKAVLQTVESVRNRHTAYIEHIVPKFLTDYNKETTAHSIIALNAGMPADVARQASETIHTGLASLQDPAQMGMGQALIQKASTMMTPDSFLRVIGLAQGLIQDSNEHLTFLRSRPDYVTEQRFGAHHVWAIGPDNKPYRWSGNDKGLAQAKVAELQRKGYEGINYTPKSDTNVAGGISPEMMASLQRLDEQAVSRMRTVLQEQPPEVLAAMQNSLSRAKEYAESLNASAPVPGAGTPGRKFVAGREDIDMLTNSNAFYRRAANWMRHKMVRVKTDVDLLDPTLTTDSVTQKLGAQAVENNITLDNPLVRKAVAATYYWKLAGNLGVNMLHGIQTLTTGMASAIAETGNVGDAFELTGRAMKEMGTRFAPKALGGRGDGSWANPFLEYGMKKALTEGRIGFGGYDDFMNSDVEQMQDMNEQQGTFGKGLNIVKHAANKWTENFMKYNDSIGIASGLLLAQERGMSPEDAYRFAVDLKNRGYYTGGKSQRAVGLWGIKSKAVPQLMSSLNTYTFGWFGQLSSNWTNGFGKAPEGVSPTQRLGAKKAFLYQLGAQAVLAGALGMPGMGQGLALLKQVTGVDTKDWLKQNLGKMADDDQQNGGLLSTLAMHGLVAGLTPIDPSGRHMISFPFTGVNPYKGFDPVNFLPAPVTAASDLVKALFAAAQGNPQGITKGLPHILQGPFKLMEGEGDVRDQRGGLLYSLSPSERVLQALGFDNSKVQDARETADMLKEANARALKQQEFLLDSLARQARTGDPEGARMRMQQYALDHPETNPQTLVKGVASRLVAQTTTPNLLGHVNPSADIGGIPRPAPQFGVQQAARASANQVLGLPAPPANGAWEAQQLDSLLQSNPALAPWEARQQLKGTGLNRSRSAGLWSQAFQ